MGGLDIQAGVSLQAGMAELTAAISGMCQRMDREWKFRERANDAFRQVPFIINVPLVAGAATLNPTQAGPDAGYYWSIRKLSAVGFTAGTVDTYVDNTGGEPIVPFTVSAVNTFGKGEQLLHPNSNIAVVAAGITGTVQIWGQADQFESWLLPWYMGTVRG